MLCDKCKKLFALALPRSLEHASANSIKKRSFIIGAIIITSLPLISNIHVYDI